MIDLYRSFDFLDFKASNSALVKYQLTIFKVSFDKAIRRLIDVTVNIRNFTVISIFERRNIESLLT